MKIILFGKNGQLGAELVNQAQNFGYELVSFGREEADITDYAHIKTLFDEYLPHIVINASAYHVVPECEANPEKAFKINASALKHLAELSEHFGTKLVHYSSDYVFDGLLGKPYKEDAKPNPLQTYGISKHAGEFFVENYTSHGIVIRTCGVYGGKIGSRAKKGNFIINIIKQAQGKKELEVSSEQIVSPTYAVDLAKATMELLGKKNTKGSYHLVNEGFCSWAEFAAEIMKTSDTMTKIIPVDRSGQSGGARRPLFSALKNIRAADIGIKLPPWQDAIKRYIISFNS